MENCKCGKVVVAAAGHPSTDPDWISAAACTCYPANDTCPSGVVCTKDHVELQSGMVRSNAAGKPDYTLIDVDMVERWAVHMTANVVSKGHNNWRLASTDEDLARFTQSAWRHFVQWLRGETDEDHAAALMFNIAGAERVRRL